MDMDSLMIEILEWFLDDTESLESIYPSLNLKEGEGLFDFVDGPDVRISRADLEARLFGLWQSKYIRGFKSCDVAKKFVPVDCSRAAVTSSWFLLTEKGREVVAADCDQDQ